MNEPFHLEIFIDGAARGNPGPAAYAFVISRAGQSSIEEKGCLGTATNNVAEYTALLKALEYAARLKATHLVIHSDSELLVKQMNGEYRVKNPDLKVLFDQATQVGRRFEQVSIDHVPREQNQRADQLCNEALDGNPAKGNRPNPPSQKKRLAGADLRKETVREEAVICLSAAASAWAKGDSRVPSPEVVWDQLWSILEDQGVLR